MSKFKAYLINEYQDQMTYFSRSRVKEIGLDKTVELLGKEAKDAWNSLTNKRQGIERGAESARTKEYGFLDTRKMPPRMSRNTTNFYTVIINGDPIWSKFPRRQIIASYVENAKGKHWNSTFSFYIFPFNNMKIGVCPRSDMWYSFKGLDKFYNNVLAEEFNELIASLLRVAKVPENVDSDLGRFKDACSKFDKWYADREMDPGEDFDLYSLLDLIIPYNFRTKDAVQFFNQNYYNSGYNLYKAILKIYNPSGFKIGKPGNMNAKDDVEIWFDGPAVYINASKINYLKGVMGIDYE